MHSQLPVLADSAWAPRVATGSGSAPCVSHLPWTNEAAQLCPQIAEAQEDKWEREEPLKSLAQNGHFCPHSTGQAGMWLTSKLKGRGTLSFVGWGWGASKSHENGCKYRGVKDQHHKPVCPGCAGSEGCASLAGCDPEMIQSLLFSVPSCPPAC